MVAKLSRSSVALPVLALGLLLGLVAGCDGDKPTPGAGPADAKPTAQPPAQEQPPLARAARAEPAPVVDRDSPAKLDAKAAPPSDDADDGDAAEQPPSEKGESKPKKKGAAKGGAKSTVDDASAGGDTDDADDADDGDATPPAKAEAPLHIKRLELATGVKKREPVGTAQSFTLDADDKIYAFIELDNPARSETHVSVTFVPPKGKATTVKLDVGDGARWRTWAKRTVGKAHGGWRVVVRDADGHELGRRSFEIKD